MQLDYIRLKQTFSDQGHSNETDFSDVIRNSPSISVYPFVSDFIAYLQIILREDQLKVLNSEAIMKVEVSSSTNQNCINLKVLNIDFSKKRTQTVN